MTQHEATIMKHFKSYRVTTDEMLFFNTTAGKAHSREFQAAMISLMRNGMVNKEMPKNAYSLTAQGYRMLRNLDCEPVRTTACAANS